MYFLIDKSLYRYNIFDENYDISTDYPAISLSSYLTSPTDISFDEHGRLLISDGREIKIFDPNYDYAYVDTTNQIVYTREVYDYIRSDDLAEPSGVPANHHVWNHFDEIGLMLGTPRLPIESNADYRKRLKDVFENPANSSHQGLINGLSRDLGLNRYDI
jgi:hypothetical protein